MNLVPHERVTLVLTRNQATANSYFYNSFTTRASGIGTTSPFISIHIMLQKGLNIP
ncbi:hypothetical protein PAAL109150_05865 [Paenibacillus alkaliterrae]